MDIVEFQSAEVRADAKIKGYLLLLNSALPSWVGLCPLFESKMYEMNIYHTEYEELSVSGLSR